MSRFLARRLLIMIPTVLGVCTLVFAFVHLIPGDPVEVMLGETATAINKAELRARLGLDDPLSVQYRRFMVGLARGDLGESIFYRRPVARVIAERVPATLELAAVAMALALVIAIPLGILAAIRQYSVFDNAAMTASMLGISMPNFWLGPLLILGFSIHLGWFPVSGREGLGSIVLPAITLGTGMAAVLSRMTRSSVLEVLREDYVTAARARGLPEWRVILVHVLRNALIPIITIMGLQFGALLSGAIVTEAVFAWPGLGTLMIRAIESRDYPLVQGCVIYIALGYVLANLVADILYAMADPRIRLK